MPTVACGMDGVCPESVNKSLTSGRTPADVRANRRRRRPGRIRRGRPHTTKRPECAVAILHNDVLPFYAARQIPVRAVPTDHGREFCGTQAHPFELYLALADIEHRKTRVRRPQTHGFVERFQRTVLDEFFRTTLRERFFERLEPLQAELDAWLYHYNFERPHRGYRNMGKRPIDTITNATSPARHNG